MIVAIVVSGIVFRHRFNAHYKVYTIEVASPGEVVPKIDPATAGLITFVVVAPLCYIAQRIATASSRHSESTKSD